MTDTNARKTFVLGALSAMATASARRLAGSGSSFVLAGRDAEQLEREADDLRARGARSVSVEALDLTDMTRCDDVLERAAEAMGGLDTVLLFYGVLGDQDRAEREPEHAATILDVNFTSAAHWVLASARALETHAGSRGVLVTASSVAGDRGRRSNFVYGAAKGGLSVLIQGLSHKWAAAEGAPRAVNLKLGFVDTPMTDGVNKGGPLWAKPDDIAEIVERAVRKPGGPTVYAPWFWRWIMLAIRTTPAAIFNKVNL